MCPHCQINPHTLLTVSVPMSAAAPTTVIPTTTVPSAAINANNSRRAIISISGRGIGITARGTVIGHRRRRRGFRINVTSG